ncbi:MAG: molybdopterin molybdotransferase [Actinomycetota bacterium]|nr:molybdopterin molybdotransferase [Actinomycetota bacterium]
MRTVDEHLADCLSVVSPLPSVELRLLDALHRVLAEDVVSSVELPGFGNSSMDGYAVRLSDVASAAPGHPVTLPVAGDVTAGPTERTSLSPGTVTRIMTGAPVPTGADAVVPVEWTDGGATTVRITRAPAAGQFVRRAGEDVRTGATVLAAGTRLAPRHVALLAAVGRATVRVHPAPRVVVLSTGDELVPPGDDLPFGGVHDANGYGLVAAARDLGAVARHGGIVPDDPQALLRALWSVLGDADLVVTSGGVSAGTRDTVKAVLAGLGTVRFEKVAVQPGMPQGVGVLGPARTPVLTLPGNPVSSLVSFEIFVRPVLRTLAGEPAVAPPAVTAVAGASWSSPPGKRQFTRAVLTERPGDLPVVTPVGGQGAHLVAALAGATCLAVVPEEVTDVRPGHELACLLLDRGDR